MRTHRTKMANLDKSMDSSQPQYEEEEPLLILLEKASEGNRETKKQVNVNTEGHGRLPISDGRVNSSLHKRRKE